jgi:hypothetical protein
MEPGLEQRIRASHAGITVHDGLPRSLVVTGPGRPADICAADAGAQR